jgi:hypothetical protein
MFRRPHWLLLIAFLLLVVMAAVSPKSVGWILVLVVLGFGFVRWQTWQAEWVIVTSKRIIRVQGVPETTTSEASLRIDRISGARMIQTVPGKLLGYATIELEAPGNHPDVRRLERIGNPHVFFLELRRVIFGDPAPPDPDDDPLGYEAEFETEPLPFLPPEDRSRRFRP